MGSQGESGATKYAKDLTSAIVRVSHSLNKASMMNLDKLLDAGRLLQVGRKGAFHQPQVNAVGGT